jgi:hypothetical protein
MERCRNSKCDNVVMTFASGKQKKNCEPCLALKRVLTFNQPWHSKRQITEAAQSTAAMLKKRQRFVLALREEVRNSCPMRRYSAMARMIQTDPKGSKMWLKCLEDTAALATGTRRETASKFWLAWLLASDSRSLANRKRANALFQEAAQAGNKVAQNLLQNLVQKIVPTDQQLSQSIVKLLDGCPRADLPVSRVCTLLEGHFGQSLEGRRAFIAAEMKRGLSSSPSTRRSDDDDDDDDEDNVVMAAAVVKKKKKRSSFEDMMRLDEARKAVEALTKTQLLSHTRRSLCKISLSETTPWWIGRYIFPRHGLRFDGHHPRAAVIAR